MRKVPDCGPRSPPGGAASDCSPNRLSRKLPRTAHGGGILRAAIVLRERRQHRAALVFAVGAADTAAAQPLKAVRDLVEIGAHLLNLVVDRTALRGPAVEQREEARAVAAHPLGLQRDAVEFGLLLGGGVLIAADLFILGRVAGASRGRWSPIVLQAGRTSDWPARAGGGGRQGSSAPRRAAPGAAEAEQDGAGQNPTGEGQRYEFPAYPAIES